MNYRYRAMTQDGQKLQGIIDANDERQARLRLREEGLFLLDIRPQKSSGVKTRRPRISHSELTLFTRAGYRHDHGARLLRTRLLRGIYLHGRQGFHPR